VYIIFNENTSISRVIHQIIDDLNDDFDFNPEFLDLLQICGSEAEQFCRKMALQIKTAIALLAENNPSDQMIQFVQHKLSLIIQFVHSSILSHEENESSSCRRSSFRLILSELRQVPIYLDWTETSGAFVRLSKYLRCHPETVAWILIDNDSKAMLDTKKVTKQSDMIYREVLYQQVLDINGHCQDKKKIWSVGSKDEGTIFLYDWIEEPSEISEPSKIPDNWYKKLSSKFKLNHCNHELHSYSLFILCSANIF
jgi:hypothetical protein